MPFPFASGSFRHAFRIAVLGAACLIAMAWPDTSLAEGGGKTSAFGPGERTLQLAPMWVPVAGARSHTKGVSAYRPMTLCLTSRDGDMMVICNRLPHMIEAFLFTMNRTPITQSRSEKLNLFGVNGRLLAEAARIAGPGVVKSVEAIDGAPHPDKTNQDLLVLCQ